MGAFVCGHCWGRDGRPDSVSRGVSTKSQEREEYGVADDLRRGGLMGLTEFSGASIVGAKSISEGSIMYSWEASACFACYIFWIT